MTRTHLLSLCFASSAIVFLSGCETELPTTLEQDAGLYETTDGSTANGVGSILVLGHTAAAVDNERRILLQFSIDDSIPSDAEITSVTLEMEVLSRVGSLPQTAELHRVTADWAAGPANADTNSDDGVAATAGDVTWLHRAFDTTEWTTEGSDFVSTLSASVEIDEAGTYLWESTDTLVSDVQLWHDSPSSNFGWVLAVSTEQAGILHRFASSAASDSGTHPVLTVRYNTPLSF